jgi:transporter family-2 protein
MQNISAVWLYPIILIAGALQAWGPPMNHTLRVSLGNPWLASLVSFLPIVAVLACLIMCIPTPLPTAKGLETMPWWAPIGGLIGAFAVVAGLLFGRHGRRRRVCGADHYREHSDVARDRSLWAVRHAGS